jgi:hypothetical protein
VRARLKTGRRISFSHENGDQNVTVPVTQTALRRQPHVHNAGFFPNCFDSLCFSLLIGQAFMD